MIEGTQQRWYTGQEICNAGVRDFELLKAVKDGKLIPYDDKTGLLVIDYNTLPQKLVQTMKTEYPTNKNNLFR